MSTETIVRYSAPTLAGLKIGSIFTCKCECALKLEQNIKQRNKLLNSKGIYFKVLRVFNGVALVYVYRKNQLEKALKSNEISEFLNKFGYANFEVDNSLEILASHLEKTDFPHEIGVFLGYPLCDVIAFIENNGKNEKFVGYWKAYFNEEDAKTTCAKFKKCTNIYCKKIAEGSDITKLTVAC